MGNHTLVIIHHSERPLKLSRYHHATRGENSSTRVVQVEGFFLAGF